MVRDIVKDPIFLSIKSTDATPADISVAMDLIQTLDANSERCVGMAANMIGVSKRIIVYADQDTGFAVVMFNPVIISSSGPYDAVEGCLSLPGERKTVRYNRITVEFADASFKKQRKEFTGYNAQIIQHEIDMTNGILI